MNLLLNNSLIGLKSLGYYDNILAINLELQLNSYQKVFDFQHFSLSEYQKIKNVSFYFS
jgi:hypothetical protein